MLLIDCPYCGVARPEIEFAYGGEAHIARPADPSAVTDKDWASIDEPWRRLLIRLFVSACMLEDGTKSQPQGLMADKSIVIDLRNIALITSYGADVARLMLLARFGHDLRDKYKLPAIPLMVSRRQQTSPKSRKPSATQLP